MESITEFVTNYIQREYTIPEDVDILSLNYIETGYVDSLGLIQFIATLEDEFSVEFSEDELLSPDIKVVGKLIDIIEQKIRQ
ncbi:MAG: acyl carrier protein [Raoultibacter sp.]